MITLVLGAIAIASIVLARRKHLRDQRLEREREKQDDRVSPPPEALAQDHSFAGAPDFFACLASVRVS